MARSRPRFLPAIAVAFAASAATAQTPGLTPINDLGAATYLGFQGGLYPGGVNSPPAAHLSAALNLAGQIVPRAADGSPNADGLIGMIAIGMSNTCHEFSVFERQEDANPNRNARLVILDTAVGGQTAAAISNPAAAYWTTVQNRITAAGLSAAQVQVAWLKEADAQPPNNFPVHAQTLRDELRTVCDNLHDKYPNLRLCYLSSRIYSYAAPGSLNPEPQAFESAFSVKWLIEAQINGDPLLNYNAANGAVRSPLLLWGPYLWANGTTPRSDGLVWLTSDLEGDLTHPGPTGEQKVANMLSGFFAADSTAAPWWGPKAGASLVSLSALKDADVLASSPGSNFGAATSLLVQGGTSPINTYIAFNASAVTRPVRLAKLDLRVIDNGGGNVSLVSNTSWGEGTITYSNAPPITPLIISVPAVSRDGAFDANVTNAVNADADGIISFGLTSTATGLANYRSKEDGQPPRLTLIVASPAPPCPADVNHDGIITPADIAIFVNTWFTSLTQGTLAGDFDGNGVVNPADLAGFVNAWFSALLGGC